MTKRDLIIIIARKARLTQKAAAEALEALNSAIVSSLKKGEKVTITGFGTFLVRPRKAKTVNFKGQQFKVSAHKMPSFIPGKTLKRAIR